MRQTFFIFLFLPVLIFLTSCEKKKDLLIDGDGNVYKTINIGSQEWLTENLKPTKYNDGTPIPLITDGNEWSLATAGAYCWYDNNPAIYKDTLGALYNWYAVDTRKLCPKGWHVPSGEEWTTMITYLGGDDVAGGKLKYIGTDYWLYPNEGATNETSFSALGAGFRFYLDGDFRKIGIDSYFWSSSEATNTTAYRLGLNHFIEGALYSTSTKPHGFSVRCMKD